MTKEEVEEGLEEIKEIGTFDVDVDVIHKKDGKK
jgi:hypothetical protein